MKQSQIDHYKRLGKGIGYMLLAWLFFTIMATGSRYATKSVSIPTVLVFQNAVSILFIIPWIVKQGLSSLKTHRLPLMVFRGVLGVGGFGCLFLAVEKTSLVNSILLNNTAPMFLPFFVWAWLKVKINHKLWPGILIGFIGVAFVLKPGAGIINPGMIYGLLAAVCLALSMITVRLLSSTERNHAVMFYYFLVALILCSPVAILNWTPPSFETLWILIGIGVFYALGQFCYVRAFHFAKPSHLGPFAYFGVVYSAIIEWLLWNQVPEWNGIVGVILIALGGTLTILFSSENLSEQKKEESDR